MKVNIVLSFFIKLYNTFLKIHSVIFSWLANKPSQTFSFFLGYLFSLMWSLGNCVLVSIDFAFLICSLWDYPITSFKMVVNSPLRLHNVQKLKYLINVGENHTSKSGGQKEA